MVSALPDKHVEVKDVTLSYGREPVVHDASFALKSPFFAILMGPNGAGKTTLIRALIGLLKPVKGRASIYGLVPWRDRGAIAEVVGYVPQVINVDALAPVTVEEVVAMGLLSKLPPPRVISGTVKKKVKEYLSLVELSDYEDKLFSELSGGERQRVLLARALIRRPKLLILDEPYSMLDFKVKCEVVELLYRIHRTLGVDVLMSAHELSPCMAYEPTVILINKKVFAIGKPSQVLRLDILKAAYPGLTEVKGLIILGEDHALRK